MGQFYSMYSKINFEEKSKIIDDTKVDKTLVVVAGQTISDKYYELEIGKAKIINNSLLVSFISSDLPFHVI